MKKKLWDIDEIPEIPFQDKTEEKWYNYRCIRCGYEEEVPDFVVDEFAVWEELKAGEFPTMICPECNGDLKYKKSEND